VLLTWAGPTGLRRCGLDGVVSSFFIGNSVPFCDGWCGRVTTACWPGGRVRGGGWGRTPVSGEGATPHVMTVLIRCLSKY
jgi:hypothetical protein